MNTPAVGTFIQNQTVAKLTQAKIAAMDNVMNRFQLDDPRKFRRARSTDAGASAQQPMSTGFHQNPVMTNHLGHPLTPQEAATQIMIQQAQNLGLMQVPVNGHRSRPSSPGFAMQGAMQNTVGAPSNFPAVNGLHGVQNIGLLSGLDSNTLLSQHLGKMNLVSGPYNNGNLNVPNNNLSTEGCGPDKNGPERGRSPRGKRGHSRPAGDPTDLALLEDTVEWLKVLRLHKYNDLFKHYHWKDLIKLTDADLEGMGITQGARTKFLKVCTSL